MHSSNLAFKLKYSFILYIIYKSGFKYDVVYMSRLDHILQFNI